VPDPRDAKTDRPDDVYSRVDYRRLIAWPSRLAREAPFLRSLFAGAPARSIVDLGCGTGEHTRFFASEGYRALGIDRSESMIAKATEAPLPSETAFELADLLDLGRIEADLFGGAICLGNTLVHVVEDEDLRRVLAGIRRLILPGGVLLIQILNYERIASKGIRNLPLNFRESDDGEIVFLRLMEPLGGGRVRFCPTTLLYNPKDDPPVRVVQTRLVEIRGWIREEIVRALSETGFRARSVYGDMAGGSYEPEVSADLVIVAAAETVGDPKRTEPKQGGVVS
jgi:SAM-dependent methyltransferase